MSDLVGIKASSRAGWGTHRRDRGNTLATIDDLSSGLSFHSWPHLGLGLHHAACE